MSIRGINPISVCLIGATLLLAQPVFGVRLLEDILDNKNINYGRFEEKWGYLHHAIVRLNLDEKNWEGGDSTTIYEQNDLSNWTLEEKRLLAFLLFLNFQFTQREVSAVAGMLGPHKETIASQLATIDNRDLARAIARGVTSHYTELTIENFRRNVQFLKESGTKSRTN